MMIRKVLGCGVLVLLAACKHMPTGSQVANAEVGASDDGGLSKTISTGATETPLFHYANKQSIMGRLKLNADPRAADGQAYVTQYLADAWSRRHELPRLGSTNMGAGIYLAADPCVSREYGDTIIILQAKAKTVLRDYLLRGIDPAQALQVVETETPAIRYRWQSAWFGDKAVVVRHPSFLDLDQVALINRPATRRRVEDLPVFQVTAQSRMQDILLAYADQIDLLCTTLAAKAAIEAPAKAGEDPMQKLLRPLPHPAEIMRTALMAGIAEGKNPYRLTEGSFDKCQPELVFECMTIMLRVASGLESGASIAAERLTGMVLLARAIGLLAPDQKPADTAAFAQAVQKTWANRFAPRLGEILAARQALYGILVRDNLEAWQ